MRTCQLICRANQLAGAYMNLWDQEICITGSYWSKNKTKLDNILLRIALFSVTLVQGVSFGKRHLKKREVLREGTEVNANASIFKM